MYVRDLSANIEYRETLGLYKVTISEFNFVTEDGQKHPCSFYLTEGEIPSKYADQSPKFQVGDLIDQVWHPDDGNFFGGEDSNYREYMGEITEIEIRRFNDTSPKRVFYYTDLWDRKKSNGIRQNGLELSINPHTD